MLNTTEKICCMCDKPAATFQNRLTGEQGSSAYCSIECLDKHEAHEEAYYHFHNSGAYYEDSCTDNEDSLPDLLSE